MGNAEKITIRPTAPNLARRVILENHYSGTVPSIQFSFGAWIGNQLLGVCVFGPTNRGLMQSCPWPTLELNRMALVKNKKNLASFLISQSLNQLPKPVLVVSYADANWNHHGYIYQATNFIYTGQSFRKGKDFAQVKINGRIIHARSCVSKYGTMSLPKLEAMGLDAVPIECNKGKYRYFYPIGKTKREKKEITKWLLTKYRAQQYPKGENQTYDSKDIQQAKPNPKRSFGLGTK